MPFYGKQLIYRHGAKLCYEQGWRWANLRKMLATLIGESQLYVGALHDNKRLITDLKAGDMVCNVETYELCTVVNPAEGTIKLSDCSVVNVPLESQWITSRDCGLAQISIPARLIGTDAETSIRTESKVEADWVPIAEANIKAARQKWEDAGSHPFKPWFAYTDGWAPFPGWWVWHQVNGEPTGPWVVTGRYIHKAVQGVANYHLLVTKEWDKATALADAKKWAKEFGIKGGKWDVNDTRGVYFTPPPAPTDPPADGMGPRPVENDGS